MHICTQMMMHLCVCDEYKVMLLGVLYMKFREINLIISLPCTKENRVKHNQEIIIVKLRCLQSRAKKCSRCYTIVKWCNTEFLWRLYILGTIRTSKSGMSQGRKGLLCK